VPIVTFNPLRERGLIAFTNPQSPAEMLSGSETRISTQYHQVKAGGDLAAIVGICKVLLDMEDAGEKVLDRLFIEEHTHGFDKFAKFVRAEDWSSIEQCSGLTRGAITKAARVYAKAEAVMLVYGMGLTQHREGVATIRTMVNLALMRGNIGRQGAGILPVRGHSNVQGQRTVGITEKPELVPLDTLSKMFNFEPPREKGLNTVEACEGILDGRVRGFIGLGGNLLRAVPDQQRIEPAWRRMRLTVHIATKLNRTHIFPGEVCYLLPCLGRTEIDVQATGPQSVSVEDSTGCFHGSRGVRTPASPHLLSEPAIVAGIAKASLRPNPNIDWDAWVADYGKVRDAIAETWPEDFHDFNKRMWTPGGFHRHIAAASRVWKTKTGKANFITPESLESETDMQQAKGPDVLRLITLRSNDQFNTTIYGYDDRFRGIHGTRMVVLMNGSDIARLRLREGDRVELQTVADDGHDRRLGGLSVVAYDIPEGCIAGYYPECNSLIPLWHHAKGSKTPAAKSIPVRVRVWHAPPLLAAE
jgi:molybdopterin-dependent oxidoreductase alpha subunit